MSPDELQALLLYRDALMLVINKPAGIAVHKGSGKGEYLEQYFNHLQFGLPRVPSLAHRLDRDTSGCLVLGRHRQALARLGKLFEKNTVKKTYWAIVEGRPPQTEGTIDLPLEKQSPHSHQWHMRVAETGGMPSRTDYTLFGSHANISWVELRPQTGRTHQLRVHMSAIGCPILGDRIYGNPSDTPLHLHARAIEIPLYPKKPAIKTEAPPPPHMLAALQSCGFKI